MTKFMIPPSMLSPDMRKPDKQYKRLLRYILKHGVEIASQQGTNAITVMGPPPLRYRFQNGFPLLTERNLAPKVSEKLLVTIWRQAIGEIMAFINGAMTLEELEKFGCYWWRDFATPEKCAKRGLPAGHLGPGSYGGGNAHYPLPGGGEMNQFEVLLDQIKQNPGLRTFFITNWIPPYIPRGEGYRQQVVVAPCHGVGVHVRIINGRMTLLMFQRSADVIVGVPSNIAQYAALALAIGQVTGYPVDEYVHCFSDAHIYVDHLPIARKILRRESRIFPTISVNQEQSDLFAFRHGDFELSDYNPHPGIKNIPLAI